MLNSLSSLLPRRGAWWVAAVLTMACSGPQASVGLAEIAATEVDGPITLYYPSSSDEKPIARGRCDLALSMAEQGVPVRGNGRLVVISHGSGGNPWVQANLARSLVQAGFVVALPTHRGDNYQDDGHPGPESWALRPAEVSRAIDAVGRDARFAPLVSLGKVGVYGFSAGGHTALSMAGGRWSPANYREHCLAHLEDDFQSCVGLATELTGGVLDGVKKWLARSIISRRYDDTTPQAHADLRIAAVVAAAPTSADFDMASLATPRMPLGLITLGQDRWLVPRFHSDRVLAACKTCEHIAHLPTAGHGAMLSPLPPFTGLAGRVLNDPPGFDRSAMAEVDRQVAAFFVRHVVP